MYKFYRIQDCTPLDPIGILRIISSDTSNIHIEDRCFQYYLPIREIDFSSLVFDSISDAMFLGCIYLEKVKLPETIRYIGYDAFCLCPSLWQMNIPDSLEYLGWLSISNTKLESIDIPENVYYLDSKFSNANLRLKEYNVSPDNKYFQSIDGVIFSKSGGRLLHFPFALETDKYIVPEHVDTITEYAFGATAFMRYTNVDKIPDAYDTLDVVRHWVFNSGLRKLESYAFHTSPLEIAENFGSTSVGDIPASCFSDSHLKGIELPIELSSIASSAFINCSRLDSVRFLGSVVSYIGQSAFAYCTSLDSLDLSAQTRLKTISAYLCAGDSSLRSVKLPTSIDSISRCAFVDCVSLSEIEVPVLDPIEIDESVFSSVDKSSCRLIVPAPSIGKYRAAPVWRDFLNIESGDFLTITVLSAASIMGGVTGTGVYRYGDSPYIAANPSRGYRFTRWSDGSTEQYRRVALTSDSTITAYFEFDPEFQYRVSARTADRTMGSVSPTTAYARYGETVTITATPLSGYRFTLWSDSVTANPRDIIVTRDTVLTAHFAPAAPVTPDTFTVTLLCDSAMGSVSGAGRYPEGTAATLTATPREGYAFTCWEDNHGLTFTDNPMTLTVTCDTTLTALFREDGTGFDPAADDGCAAWVTPDGTLRVRCPGCRLMELRTVTGLTLYSGAPADIPLPMPGIYIREFGITAA